MNHVAKAAASVFLIAGVFLPAVSVSAQYIPQTYTPSTYAPSTTYVPNLTYTTPTFYPSSSACPTFSSDLHAGMSDNGTGSVAQLQRFLSDQGYLSSTPTGYYGSLTTQAVSNFQYANGISPTGSVGPATRAAIQEVCSSVSSGSPTAPQIRSVYPPSGGINTQVTLFGKNFLSDNAIYFDNEPIARTSAANAQGTQLSFTVPSNLPSPCGVVTASCPEPAPIVGAGQHTIFVQNANGTSGSVPFNIYGAYVPRATISNINIPGPLYVGQQGTWAVYVASPGQSASNVRLSVRWGDEALTPYTTYNSYQQNIYGSNLSAQFTHAYQLPGRYTITFALFDEAGEAATQVISVNVQ